MPFHFLEDISTADVAFEARGETQAEMFISCADALLRTMAEAPEQIERKVERIIRLDNEELDLLLFAFLQELIFYKDARRLLLHADHVQIEEREGVLHLESLVRGEQIDRVRHHLLVDVKAVTLHRFQVLFRDNAWRAVVELDV
jgi:SHS2 domain-containing protein